MAELLPLKVYPFILLTKIYNFKSREENNCILSFRQGECLIILNNDSATGMFLKFLLACL